MHCSFLDLLLLAFNINTALVTDGLSHPTQRYHHRYLLRFLNDAVDTNSHITLEESHLTAYY
jgi:hypothetical protein